jgi:hypothetical protein
MDHDALLGPKETPRGGLVQASLVLAVLLDVLGVNPSGMYLSCGNYWGVVGAEVACAVVIFLPLWRYYVRYGRPGLAAASTSVAGICLIVGLRFVLITGTLVCILCCGR